MKLIIKSYKVVENEKVLLRFPSVEPGDFILFHGNNMDNTIIFDSHAIEVDNDDAENPERVLVFRLKGNVIATFRSSKEMALFNSAMDRFQTAFIAARQAFETSLAGVW